MKSKYIKGYNRRYKITDDGRVWSNFSNKYLAPYKNRGYHKIRLSLSGGEKTYSVHRLVAMYFVEGYEPGKEVNHKNGIKSDNRASNLEWVTRGENHKHAYKNGLREIVNRKRIVPQTIEGELLWIYESITDAAKDNDISISVISKCINDRTDHGYGFVWNEF